MSEQFDVTVENRKNTGTNPQWNKTIRSGTTYTFGKVDGGSQPVLNSDVAPPMWATNITHNKQGFQLKITPDKPGIGPEKPVQAGQVIALNRAQPNDRIDITKWTIIAEKV